MVEFRWKAHSHGGTRYILRVSQNIDLPEIDPCEYHIFLFLLIQGTSVVRELLSQASRQTPPLYTNVEITVNGKPTPAHMAMK